MTEPSRDSRQDDTHPTPPRRRGRRWTRRRGSGPRGKSWDEGGAQRPGGGDGRHTDTRDRQDTLDDWAESDDDVIAETDSETVDDPG